jgi:hypothetical protein
MKKLLFIIIVTSVALTSCIKVNISEDYGNGGTNPGGSRGDSVISGKIDVSKTYTQGKYILKGYVYVTNNATLTFNPGCVIVSDISEKGALIVEKGSKLIAEGSATNPIVFTSGKPAGSRAVGDWGGIILLGKAPTNRPLSPEPIIEGGVNRTYGGTDANDNSGILRYVRIEFAGIAAEPGSEINGLTLGGVGAGTILDYIQVSYGNDDAYEFFGGTVNAKHLIAFATMDDDFDFDFGFTGKLQYGISLRDKPSDIDQANGVECDNDGSGTSATPYTKPSLVNFTLIGPYDTAGAAALHGFGERWRRATRFVFRNNIQMGHRLGGFVMENDPTLNAYIAGESEFKQNLLHAYTRVVGSSNQAILSDAALRTKVEAEGSKIFASRDEIMLENPFNLATPNFKPKTGSPAITPAVTAADNNGLDAFFVKENFRGAIGTTDWTTTGWASWTPKTNSY